MKNGPKSGERLTPEGNKNMDAYKLYWYACTEGKPYYSPQADGSKKRIKTIGCGHRERMYNSRDGVVPFMAFCPSCGGVLQHVDWNLDVYAGPDYKPNKGQRVWITLTIERAREIANRRMDMAKEQGGQYYDPERDTPEFREELAQHMVSEFGSDAPDMMVTP